jgi:hypothetical protein
MNEDLRIVRIRALHTPIKIWGECGHDCHKPGDEGVADIDDIGLTCEYLYSVCQTCCFDGEWPSQSETCATEHDHGLDKPICKTRAILDGVANA